MEKSKKERMEKLNEKTKNLNLDDELYIFVNNIKWGDSLFENIWRILLKIIEF